MFIIKIIKWEYWTWWLFYLPLMPYWLWLALKARSFTYFTASNPSIENGGFFGEHKTAILNLIDEAYKPRTLFFKKETKLDELKHALTNNDITFPFILKPDVGERGTGVEKINSELELKKYVSTLKEDFLVQEFVTHDIELGVLFARYPNEEKGKVTSVVIKKFLTVTGNGTDTILQLMEQQTRARFQIKRFKKEKTELLKTIPKLNEVVLLEPIGNHCRGTEFLSGQHLINEQLHQVFNKVAKDINGFYYGRFDMKVKSYNDLYQGQTIKIMELNGVSSEPAHIYDPKNSLLNAYRDLTKHWKLVYDISQQNRKQNVPTASLTWVIKEAYKHIFA